MIFKKVVDDRSKTGRREDDALQYLIDQGDNVTDMLTFVLRALLPDNSTAASTQPGSYAISHTIRNGRVMWERKWSKWQINTAQKRTYRIRIG